MKQFIARWGTRLVQRVHRMVMPELLEYAPRGWDTPLDREERGWSAPRVVEEERRKWNEYARLVGGTGPLGFSHEASLAGDDNILFHNLNYTFGYAVMRAAWGRDRVSVLDWGGGLGHYYLLARSFLPRELELEYHCRDLPALVAVGRELAPQVVWHEDDTCLGRRYDLVVVSGSLQYCREWKQFLARLRQSVGSYLLLTRTPVVSGAPTFVAVQRAYGTKMLHQQFNQGELLRELERLGFMMIREIALGDPVCIKNAPEDALLKGWLFGVPEGTGTRSGRDGGEG